MYVRLSSIKPLVIGEGPKNLPTSYKNISGFERLSNEELRGYDFYPFEKGQVPSYDPNRQELEWEMVLGTDYVVRNLATVKPVRESILISRRDSARKALLDALAKLRWETETSGVVFEGNVYSSQRDGDLTLYLASNEGVPHEWKTKNGEWVTLSSDDLKALVTTIRQHRKECYAKEATIAKTIKALSGLDDIQRFSLKDAWHGQS